MFKKYWWILVLLILPFCSVISYADIDMTPDYVSSRTTNIKIGFLTDTHFQGTSNNTWNDDYLDTSYLWQDAVAKACSFFVDNGYDAVINAGDISYTLYLNNQARLDSQDGFWNDNLVNRGVRFVPVIGNHEFVHSAIFSGQPDTLMYPNEDVNLAYQIQDVYHSDKFDGRGFYKVDIGAVRIIVLTNLQDTVTVQGGIHTPRFANNNRPGKSQAYWLSSNSLDDPNANGEGPWTQDSIDAAVGNINGVNEDSWGITDENSSQWAFAESEAGDMEANYKIVTMHRSIFAYSHTENRPNAYGQRYGIVPQITERNVPLMFNGDTHVNSLTKIVHTEEDGNAYVSHVLSDGDSFADSSYAQFGLSVGDSIGTKFLVLRSGLQRPLTENTVAPNKTFPNNAASDVLWSQDTPDSSTYNFVWFGGLTVNGDRGFLEIFKVAINSGDLSVHREYFTTANKQ